MGWWTVGDGLSCGDAPLDLFGDALTKIAECYRQHTKRLPQLAELLVAFDASDTTGVSATHDAMRAAIAGPMPSSKRAPPLQTGELVAIPYDGDRAVVGLVLFGAELRIKGPGFGSCLVALDVEPTALELDIDVARIAPWLIRPFHPGSHWQVERLGRVVLAPDASFLPCFAWYALPGSSSRSLQPSPGHERRVTNYFDLDVTGQPGVEARVVPPSIGGNIDVRVGIRAARGLNRPLPGSTVVLASDAGRMSLAQLPPFRAAPKPKPRARKPAALEHADERVTTFAANTLAVARRGIECTWCDSVGRAAVREEIAYAFALVLASSKDQLVTDSMRLATLFAKSPSRAVTHGDPPPTFELGTARGHDIVTVKCGSKSWHMYPFREHDRLVAETLYAPSNALAFIPKALALWRTTRQLPAHAEPVLVRPMDDGATMNIMA